ncbi:hypothetical protein Cgig2_032305 [Carnegiea gigantea]|uniref:SWIM-type domain-containing protein n=1 Tax=Carnegiea gigantea TaxID=171969 RepID=A0A9Q1JUI6_9CARY|nr:hypothetical protein Cgig2_032305 [Carnegiea gigantea]
MPRQIKICKHKYHFEWHSRMKTILPSHPSKSLLDSLTKSEDSGEDENDDDDGKYVIYYLVLHLQEASRAGEGYYSVTQGTDAFIMRLTKGTCSCKSWELNGLPCSHAMVVMREESLNPMIFVHDRHSITAPYFKPKMKTTCKFKKKPEARENTKGSTYGKVERMVVFPIFMFSLDNLHQ